MISDIYELVLIPGEDVPEEERLSSKDPRSVEPCDNTPIIDNLLQAGGGASVSSDERSRYEEDISNLYKQLDDKVRAHPLIEKFRLHHQCDHLQKESELLCFCRMMRSTNTVSWLRN